MTLLVIAFGFFRYGFLMGVAFFFGFMVLVSLNRTFLLPKPESSHFREIIIKSMIRRHANYLRNDDKLRAYAMAHLLERAEIPVGEFVRRSESKGGD